MEEDGSFWLRNFKEHLKFLIEHLEGELLYEAEELCKYYYNYDFEELVDEIGIFKYKIYNLVNEGKTNVPFGLIEHQVKEYDYFVNKLNDDVSIIEEIEFWNENDKEHLQINLKHLDKDNLRDITLCNSLISSFNNLDPNNPNFLKRSCEIAITTDKFHKNIRYSSINRQLLSHIIEEGQRGIVIRSEILNLLD